MMMMMMMTRKSRDMLASVMVLLVLGLTQCGADLPAKDYYFMDQRSDCFAAGIQSIARGQQVIVYGRSNMAGPVLECSVKFEPVVDGDTLTVTFGQERHFNDPSVELSVSLSNSKRGDGYTYGSLSRDLPPELKSVDGVATIHLKKGSIDADFMFQITVSAKETEDPDNNRGSGTADIGLIAGLVIGLLILIIIIAVIAIIFVRKRRDNREEKGKDDAPDGRSRSRSFNRVERVEKEVDHGSSSNLSLSYDKRSIQF